MGKILFRMDLLRKLFAGDGTTICKYVFTEFSLDDGNTRCWRRYDTVVCALSFVYLCRFHMFNANRQPETVTNAQTGGDEETFARPFDVRMPRVWHGLLFWGALFAVAFIFITLSYAFVVGV